MATRDTRHTPCLRTCIKLFLVLLLFFLVFQVGFYYLVESKQLRRIHANVEIIQNYSLSIADKLHRSLGNVNKNETVQTNVVNKETNRTDILPHCPPRPPRLGVTPAKNRDVKVVNMERRDRIRKVCAAKEEELRRNKSMVDLSGSMYIDEKHNLTYCHLFKSAFTYWSLLFQIVRGDVSATSPFDPALYRQRGREIPSLQKLPHKQRKEFFNSSFSFMFTRNPYSRLLSAYTDKFFMPNYFWLHTAPSIGKVVRRKSIPCVHDLQFNEFIRFIIDSEEKQYAEDTHFRFAFDFCDPCQYKYDFIGKLETINEDTKYLLRKMNRTAVIKALEKDPREQYINFTIKERTDMLFKINGTRWICKESFYQLQKKMWKGFQMNGIISKESKYPVTEESSNMISLTNFSDMVFNAIRDAKDGNVSRKNKAEAMLEAYSTVDVEDMDKLSKLLRPDCDVFGYDCRPRKLFKDRKRIKPWYFDVTTA